MKLHEKGGTGHLQLNQKARITTDGMRFVMAVLSAFASASFLGLLSGFDYGAFKAPEALLPSGLLVKLSLWLGLTFLFFVLRGHFPWLLSWTFSAAAFSLCLIPLTFRHPNFNLFLIALLFDLFLVWTVRESYSRKRVPAERVMAFILPLPLMALLPACLLYGVREAQAYPPVPPIPAAHGEQAETYFALDSGQLLLFFLLLAILAVLIGFFMSFELHRRGPLSLERISRAPLLAALLALSAAFYHLFFMGRLLLARVRSLSVPSYDFGLFSQMYHYLLRYGLPLTTLERDGLFSHFGVHLSPIYYLFLPFYALAPFPETLQILQLLCVCSGVLPLLLLCRHFSLRPLEKGLFAALYLLQPGLIFSGAYDFHENCFLAPLTLWLLWGILEARYPAILITALLLLCVKEDAALYLISAALFLAFYRDWKGGRQAFPDIRRRRLKERIQLSLALIFLALGIFTLQFYYLSTQGEGVMGYRFLALSQFESLGPAGIPLAVLANPSYYLALIAEAEKLRYLLPLLFTFGLLPFLQHKAETYLLFIPLLVMNLWSDYPYQSNIFFQYHYGSHAFLIAATLLSYAEFRRNAHGERCCSCFSPTPPWRQAFKRSLPASLLLFALISSFCFSQADFMSHQIYIQSWQKYASRDTKIREALKEIPRDKEVAATTFLTTQLSDCDRLYDIDFNRSIAYGRPVDLLVFDLRYVSEWQAAVQDWYSRQGYERSEELSSDFLLVLAREAGQKADGSNSSSESSR